MLKIDKEKLLNEQTVNKVQFNNEWYFDVDSVASHLKEDLSEVESITLPFGSDSEVSNGVSYKKAATIENIEKGRKQEPLSEFNKALLKAKNFKDR
ncbi:hypothetical protein E0W68_10300 [Flavobacterium salilacus subsp. salilacus]|uniref:hypothetical protein n=1 Tax=Flavobacterium TaxID=237 RepID=UPI0010754D0F|nr:MULTISPECIES: hypothetical protein [Flavobacterium]KAF2518120.1 hypothetical protein E0W68_10300 [Flavobacterium salilacus subsp. salilacus]MBE1615570.1 hypothetical protein [Flavobacterium sp. SaA2.13]